MVSMCLLLLLHLHHWVLLLLGDVCVQTHGQPQIEPKLTKGKPMLWLPLWHSCRGKAGTRLAEASGNDAIICLLVGQLQEVFLFPLLLVLQLHEPLTACSQESGKTRTISLSNQDFVLLQYRSFNQIQLQTLY